MFSDTQNVHIFPYNLTHETISHTNLNRVEVTMPNFTRFEANFVLSTFDGYVFIKLKYVIKNRSIC